MNENDLESGVTQAKRFAEKQLMEQIAAPANILAAWRSVRGNVPRYRRTRSSGPDHVTLEEFERELAAQLDALRYALLNARYQPQPPALVKIRKPNGGERQIAVLSVVDRVAQRAAQQVLEPIWESTFLPCSFGFRPGLSINDAVTCARKMRQSGELWVVDGDIAACFDSLDHQILMRKIEARVQDPRVIHLLNLWIEQGILEHGVQAQAVPWWSQSLGTVTGTLQRGAEWAMDAVNGPEDAYPQRLTTLPYRDYAGPYPPLYGAQFEDDLTLQPETSRRSAIQQLITGGLMLGAGWIRPALISAGKAIVKGLSTSAGREILRKGAVAGGGVVGAAVGLGAAAWLLYRELGPSPAGVLQGSPLSPLLANVYLHTFDLGMTKAGYHLVRFADDWVVCCSSELIAERAYNQAVISLSRIRLKLNPEKTHIKPPSEPVQWLGELIPPAGRSLPGSRLERR